MNVDGRAIRAEKEKMCRPIMLDRRRGTRHFQVPISPPTHLVSPRYSNILVPYSISGLSEIHLFFTYLSLPVTRLSFRCSWLVPTWLEPPFLNSSSSSSPSCHCDDFNHRHHSQVLRRRLGVVRGCASNTYSPTRQFAAQFPKSDGYGSGLDMPLHSNLACRKTRGLG